MSALRPLPVLDHRLVVVTGKGGVGKSTVAGALGILAARQGRRVLVAELARRDDVGRALGSPAGEALRERELAPGLFGVSIDPERAMEEYLLDQLPVRSLAETLAGSRLFTYLAAATPGLRELLAIGKVWELAQPDRRTEGAQPYDLVIADAPATGHGAALLSAPRTFAAAAGMGPVARQARTIHAMLADPRRTCTVVVSSPTEASVTETAELAAQLGDALGSPPAAVVLNGMLPRRFSAADGELLRRALEEREDGAPARALSMAVHAQRRAGAQATQASRLRTLLGAPLTLPFLFVPELGSRELGRLAGLLEERL